MSEFHGRLLIGGMTLGNLFGTLEQESPSQTCQGEILIDPSQNEYLESGRPYRLELEDGRAAQIVLTRVECILSQPKLRVAFNSLSPLMKAKG